MSDLPDAPGDDAGPLRVLVVDDDPVSRKVALGALEQLGHSADEAENGAEAVAAASRTRYALILLDCEMPVLDGFEAARQIRAAETEGGHRACIVAVTGSVRYNDEQRCFDAGMNAYVTKPLRARRLAAIIGGLAPSPD